MSGLSSLSGAPSPFSKASDTKQGAPAAKSESLSSLASAPPLGRATTPTGTSTSTAPWSMSSKKAEPARMSTPVFSSSKAAGNKDDDDDGLFPKSRGLVQKELRKAASTRDEGKGSDSDEDLRPPSSSRNLGGATSGSAFGATTKKAATPSSTASSSNPILAMMAANDDDDDFLASLAPPSAKASTAASSSVTAGMARSASSTMPARKDVRPASGASAVTKSVDTLMSFWKDDELLGKPLPIVEEEPQQDNLLGDRASAGPKRGRRAGGDDTPSGGESPSSPSLFPSATAAATTPGSGVSITASGAGRLGQQTGSMGMGKPMSPFEPLAASEVTQSMEAPPSLSASLAGGVHSATTKLDSRAMGPSMVKTRQAAPANPSNDADDDLSDSDLPGMGSQPARSSTSPPASNAATVPVAGRRSTSPLGGTSTQLQPAQQPAAHDSWEMDDSLLPDSSNSRQASKPASTPAATGVANTGAAGAGLRQPSRLQHSSSVKDYEHHPLKSPSLNRMGADDDMAREDEESSGYSPSFAANASVARSAPAPFTKAVEGGERQRRVIPDSNARANLGGAPRSKDEEERERTAAAMAAALARREQLQAGQGGTSAPSNTGFRLPSERRAIDALSVHINSPAGSTPKLGGPQAASAGAGTRSGASGSGNKQRSALQALDSSTDDELFGPPLQKTKSPAQSQQLSHTGNASGASGRLRTGGAAGTGGIATSAPDGSHFTASQQQQLPHEHGFTLNTQTSAPPMQLNHVGVPALQAQRGNNLPPGVSAGTAHQHASYQQIPSPLQHPQQGQLGNSGLSPLLSPQGGHLPPGVTQLNMASGGMSASGAQLGYVALQAGSQLPPNVVPLSGMPPKVVPLANPNLPPGVTQPSQTGAHGQLPPGVTHITPMGSSAAQSAEAGLPAVAGAEQIGPLQLRDVTSRLATLQVELDKGHADLAQLKDENTRLKKQVTEQEDAIKDKEQQVRDAENRLISHEARSKLCIAETQALSLKESVALRGELEDLQASLSRVIAQYAELEQDKARETTRLRGELDERRAAQAAETQALKEDIAGMVVAAEARGRRAGLIEKEVAEAQIKAQQAAIEEEKEVVHRHRISAELLAQLTEKVRAAASSTWEREERALRTLEREVADKESRLQARERALTERENKLCSREKEMESLREELNSLTRTLEGSMAHEKEEMRREQERLTRESARMSALQTSLMADKEDLKVQVAMERQLLEDAREARRKERENLLNEVAADRKALAAEHADVHRQMDASRAELLQLKSKLVEYEGRAAAALQQALAEEARLAKARKATEEEVAAVDTARVAMQVDRQALESEAASLVEFARKLQQQSAELAANNQELQQLKMDLVEARQEAARELAEAHAKSLSLEDRSRQADVTKKTLDQDRLSIASERRALNEERLAASQAASDARDAQLKLAEAVRQWIAQGVPIPFTVEPAQGGTGMTVKPGVALGGPIPSMSPSKAAAAAAGLNNRRDRGGNVGAAGRSRNSLRYMLDKLGLDMMMEGGGAGGGQAGALAGSHTDYIKQQKQFLTQLRMSAPSAGIIDPIQVYHTTMAPAPTCYQASDFKFMSQGAVSHPTATASFHGFTGSAMHKQTMQQAQQRGVAGQMFAADMGSNGASTGGVPFSMYVPAHPLANMQYEQSDASDRHTGISSDFPAMVPVSTSTSEHDGGHSAGDESEGQRSAKAGSRAAIARQAINRHNMGSQGTAHQPAAATVPVASLHSHHHSISAHPIQGLGHTMAEAVTASCSSGPGSPGPQGAVAMDIADAQDDSSISSTGSHAVQHSVLPAVPGGAVKVQRNQGGGAGGGGRLTDLSDTAVSPLRSAGVRTPSGTSSGSNSKAESVSSAAAGH